ncbi:uncharacterized protein K452DRAFT_48983 [Aplosporella prunicola CBS 121167]|uniref:Copper-fist domain-containing protein n=1 Tax=Aplosporella prunicola CBS 121167 TaxID=1176127 RepID=A0A6A6BB75_9PEZI|nr:uncharacterized protein K452DRAFT_48983 [Aplosporella prunicola CBS 121167]KAF2140613.1 hypothetical protein K452DRAFT_48983 [Aplosporella prunicola CBS 121167]
MPWVTINGERKKVACGPCIRGHRSTTCNHTDRVLLEVRKPGRPLSTCPHPAGKCSCERLVINYTIPRASECACPGDDGASTPVVETSTPSVSSANRVQKKNKKTTNTRNPVTLEKAIQDIENLEQQFKITPTKSCCSTKLAASTPASSNAASPPSTNGTDSPRADSDVNRGNETNGGPPKPDLTSEEKPLRVQLETIRGNFTSTSSAGSWGYGAFGEIQNAAPVVEKTSENKGSCCKGKGKTSAEQLPAPEPKSTSSSSASSAGGNGAPQASNGIGLGIQNRQQPFGVGHQYPNFMRPDQFGTQPHNGPFTNGGSGLDPGYTTMNAGMNGYSIPYANLRHEGVGSGRTSAIGNDTVGGAQHDFRHDCTCGDSCACLGCAAHPRNDTTMRYIREITDFMVHSPYYDSMSMLNHQQAQYQPSYPVQNSPSSTIPGHTPGVGGLPYHRAYFNPSGVGVGYQHGASGGSLWQQQQPPSSNTSLQATPTSELQQFHLGTQENVQRNVGQQPYYSPQQLPSQFQRRNTCDSYTTTTPYEQAATPPNTGDDTPILSPSSFFLQQLELPGCDDLTGACRCGDGCQCVGCLTHGGHDGVPLERPSSTRAAHSSGAAGTGFAPAPAYPLQSQARYDAPRDGCCGSSG